LASTSFTNGVTLSDSSWFNDTNVAVYSVLGDGTTPPSTAVGAMKNLFKQGANIASATTTNLASATGNYLHITGTTTITGFGTVNAGVPFWLVFDGALTITYNATSMILPGAASIATAAGDSGLFISEGSGNWRCLNFIRQASASFIPSGIIMDYGGSTAPAGWLACDGSAVSRTTYANLFTAIGTTWCVGDGSTTFNLPDLRGRTTIGDGTGSGLTARTLGTQNIGEENHVLTVPEIPSHNHTVTSYSNDVNGDIGRGFGGTSTSGIATTSTGGGGGHNNMQPSAVVKKIIKI